MTRLGEGRADRAWEDFVIAHGHQAVTTHLAFVLGQPVAEIRRLRTAGVCPKGGRRKTFPELFRLWYGREATDDEWPVPAKVGRGGYEWQGPELALLASLVGRIGKPEIAQVLTERLRRLTGDATATRNPTSVQIAIGRIGMQTKDVVGGITVAEAGREIGSLPVVHQAIRKGDIRAQRVGRAWVIPHETWAAWKARRVFPPAGYVPLTTLKQPLAIRSDKLSEFARMGYVPTAVRCNPYGTGLPSTRFGTWYIDPKVAEELVADRHAGRPMPWHGKALADNLRVTYRLWQQRKHPSGCKTCAEIWGRDGAPRSFEEYTERYPALAHGAKRHLTLPWAPSLTVPEVARKAGCAVSCVRRAVANGTVNVQRHAGESYITKTDATRWVSRGCPAGDDDRSWVSLATASKRYLFTARELDVFVAAGRLKAKAGTTGAMRGVVYVASQQCAKLREEIGFTETEAARRAGVSVSELRHALVGVNWRGTGAIPLVTVQAVIKRLQSRPGLTIEDAAEAVGQDSEWVRARIKDGTVRVLRRRWDQGHPYLSEPMVRRLRDAAASAPPPESPGADALRLSEAAREAGVTTGTILKWANSGELHRFQSRSGWRYLREAVRTRARLYWRHVHFHRANPPEWLRAETRQSGNADGEGG